MVHYNLWIVLEYYNDEVDLHSVHTSQKRAEQAALDASQKDTATYQVYRNLPNTVPTRDFYPTSEVCWYKQGKRGA